MKLTRYIRLVPTLRMSGAIPLFPPTCHNGVGRDFIYDDDDDIIIIIIEIWILFSRSFFFFGNVNDLSRA